AQIEEIISSLHGRCSVSSPCPLPPADHRLQRRGRGADPSPLLLPRGRRRHAQRHRRQRRQPSPELVDVRRRERVGQRAAGGAGPGVAADREGARPRGARVAGRDGRLTAINFVFSDYGAYSGSTLATQGHFITTGPSERSIVGGTGKLRFARGYMTSKLLSSTDTAIVVVFDMYFTLDH
ncbi:Os04g0666800, partial [Oryza sativa Japonica Group]